MRALLERVALVLGQVLGLAAVLVGIWGLAGLWWALLAAGLLAAVGCTALEVAALARPGAPGRGRHGPSAAGVG
jgi:hypothetical protein